MAIAPDKVDALLALIRKVYPDWKSFAHAQFQKDEPEYKRKTITKAQEILGEVDLRRLVDEQQWDEFVRRLDAIGKSNNLLYRSQPQSGDLSVLYHEKLDKATFAQAMLDLLYGPGNSPERLDQYSQYIEAHQLPNKWTFPTFFLFVCHPDSDLFVKPMTITWYMQFVGLGDGLPPKPSGAIYGLLVENARQLLETLASYGARDMVDVQSLIWVARHGAQTEATQAPRLVTPQRRAEFAELFQEFTESYATQPVGQQHLARYQDSVGEFD
jgi:5-methylcytosine-specific restriction enzyme B